MWSTEFELFDRFDDTCNRIIACLNRKKKHHSVLNSIKSNRFGYLIATSAQCLHQRFHWITNTFVRFTQLRQKKLWKQDIILILWYRFVSGRCVVTSSRSSSFQQRSIRENTEQYDNKKGLINLTEHNRRHRATDSKQHLECQLKQWLYVF